MAYGQMLLHNLLGLPSGAEAPLFRSLYVRAKALTPESVDSCLRQGYGGQGKIDTRAIFSGRKLCVLWKIDF